MEKKIIPTCVLCKHDAFELLFTHRGGKMGRCRACGLVQVVPMSSARDIAKLYHEDFDHFAPYIEQADVHRMYFRQKVQDIKKMLTSSKAKKRRILDIGCAMGVLLQEAQKQGMQSTGVDISADAVSYCKELGLAVFAGTVEKLGKKLTPESFDVVSAFQIIEHERDPLRFMRRVYALLVKGGLVVLATPNYGGIWRKVMGKRWVGFTHPEHVVLLDDNSMRTLLVESGFRDIEIRPDSPRPFPLSFALKRAADYFPFFSWILKPVGKLFDRFDIKNPLNPWDDMIVYARK